MTVPKQEQRPFFHAALRVFRTALLTTGLAVGVSLAVNAVRPDGLPLVARESYEILVPCPEPGGPVSKVSAADPSLLGDEVFIVDARSEAAFEAWRFGNAENLTYDYLDPVPDGEIETLTRAIARSGKKQVIVYGDGDVPDTGEQLGKELSGNGIKNVFFVEGGAPALKKRKQGGQ